MMAELLRAKPRMVIMLAFLVIGAGLTLGLAREALADYTFRCATSGCGSNGWWDGYNYIDYDRYVPEFNGAPISGHYDNKLGFTWKYYDGRINRWIEYDAVEMRNECANSWTWNDLIWHERAHSRGWGHYEPGNNAAYDPYIYTPCGP